MIKNLCEEYTCLKEKDIDKIIKISEIIDVIAELLEADVFIDCKTRDLDTAIVVAQSKVKSRSSLYMDSIVGQFALRCNEPAVLRTLEIGMASRDLRAVTQENKTVKQQVVPIENEEGKVIAALIAEKDITEEFIEEKNMLLLSKTNDDLNSINNKDYLQEHLNDGIVIFNHLGKSTYLNTPATDLYKRLGYKDELIGIEFENLTIDNNVTFEDIKAMGAMKESEVTIGWISLKIRYAITRHENDELSEVIMIITDISEAKAREKELISKSVAIKEIHHRVKNNLQTVASLLRLQSRRIEDEKSKLAFKDSISRILSIAVTHEVLAQNGVDEINIKKILSIIKDNILNLELKDTSNIEVCIIGDDITVDSDKATSIALVVNELLQNSLKHAFPHNSNGNITINVNKGRMYSSISIVDNGVGFDIDNTRSGSLGIGIVKGIVKDKLQGQLNMQSNQSGTKIMFDFKNE